MELHGSPCYCPILGFSSVCGLAHRTAPLHPCLAWGSRGWRCVAGTQKWAANCWHLEWKRSINQIIRSLKQGCSGEWHRGGPYGARHCSSLAKMMSVYFMWRAQILMVLERTVCQSWAFHLQPQSNSALSQLWNRSFGSDQMAHIKANSMPVLCQHAPGTARTRYCSKVTQEKHRNNTLMEAEMLQRNRRRCPVLQSALNISATVPLFLRTLKGPAGWRLNLELCEPEYQHIQD